MLVWVWVWVLVLVLVLEPVEPVEAVESVEAQNRAGAGSLTGSEPRQKYGAVFAPLPRSTSRQRQPEAMRAPAPSSLRGRSVWHWEVEVASQR